MIRASEIQHVRDFGTESATQQVQAEVARKLGRLRNDAETTFEYHLFNRIQGLAKDPRDGATVVNYLTEFGIAAATEVDFDRDNATPASGDLAPGVWVQLRLLTAAQVAALFACSSN